MVHTTHPTYIIDKVELRSHYHYTMKTEHHNITVNEKSEVSSAWLIPEHYQSVLIIAHGAGNDMHSDYISFLHEQIAERGILTIKFNFPYKQRGKKAPDRAPVLEATWHAVIADVLAKSGCTTDQIFLSGKSMGGRYASMVAHKYDNLGGLIFFGYPLHAPGKPDKARFDHFAAVRCPLLFIQGTRDSLCKLDSLKPLLATLQPTPKLHIIEGGDHSFKVLKSLNRSVEEVLTEVANVSIDWIDAL